MQTPGTNLGEALLNEGLISREQLMNAIKQQRESEFYLCLGRVLVDMKAITENVMLRFLNKKFGVELVSLADRQIDPNVFAHIPKSVAMKYKVVPITMSGDVLKVAMLDPTDLLMIDNLKTLTGVDVRAVVASSADIDKVLDEYPEDAELEEIIAHREPGLAMKLVKNLSLPILVFVPFIVFIAILTTNTEFQKAIEFTPGAGFDFDLFLYIIVGWGIWSLVIYEVHSIIFDLILKPRKKA